MKNANHLILATTYFLLIVIAEVSLFYAAESMPEISDYSMLLIISVFLSLAWLLKLKIPAVIIATVLTVSYGVLSFYSNFPIYFVGYPVSIEEFLPTIGIKTGYYITPLIAYVAIAKK